MLACCDLARDITLTLTILWRENFSTGIIKRGRSERRKEKKNIEAFFSPHYLQIKTPTFLP